MNNGDLTAERPRPDEKLVQWIWRNQYVEADALVCVDGREVRVLSPGEVGAGRGPDFRNAVLEIGGVRMGGDVEIHVQSTDWRAHKHSGDYAYNRVVLHVFLWALGDEVPYEELQNGIRVPRLEMGNFLEPDFDTLAKYFASNDWSTAVALDPVAGDEDINAVGSGLLSVDSTELFDDVAVVTPAPPAPTESPVSFSHSSRVTRHSPLPTYPCFELLKNFDPGQRDDLLRRYGNMRIQLRIARFAALAQSTSLGESLWSSFFSGLAHGGSRPLMFALAGRVMPEELASVIAPHCTSEKQIAGAIESVLLHVAGLVPSPVVCANAATPIMDDVAQAWLNQTHEWWSRLSGWYEDRVMKPNRLWHAGMRPANFPERRLAGMAVLLSTRNFRNGLLSGFASELYATLATNPKTATDFRKVCAALTRVLTVEGDDAFWTRRFSLKSKPTASPQMLIGTDRASSLMFNIVLPHVILHAQTIGDAALETHTRRVMAHWPATADNRTVRLVNERLFGADAKRPRFEIHQQAMLAIHAEHCSVQPCAECALTTAHCF